MSQSTIITDVPVIGQYPKLPTGCEATALTMLLQWAGVQVTKEDVADALVKEPLPFERDGRMIGGHPNRGFVGDPYTEESFGVFHEPIAAAVETFLPGRADDRSGMRFAELLALIDEGRPVVVWA
ncbi:MAG: C39 family peptidase, partial [Tumebacillaceae bacterium]